MHPLFPHTRLRPQPTILCILSKYWKLFMYIDYTTSDRFRQCFLTFFMDHRRYYPSSVFTHKIIGKIIKSGVDILSSPCYNIFCSQRYGLLAQLVEHIVHIDGVTGSSPVQTTIKPCRYECLQGFFYIHDEGGNPHEVKQQASSCQSALPLRPDCRTQERKDAGARR